MKVYKIYKHPSLGAEAVKVGFSWPAAFFVVFWMLAKKLWTLAGLWVLAYIVLARIQDAALKSLSTGGIIIVLAGHLVLGLVPAFKGNEWRMRNLTKRGYEFVDSARAETPDAAIAQVGKSSGV
ncbi:MAG: DUF2628 domain-containing protein [Candidatus Deferrimicrobiaceae bacterium]